jgi:hypothetical protein
VNSSKLNDEQLDRLNEIICRYLRFVGAMRQRMERLAFPPDDPLYRATTQGYNGLHAMRVELHYLSTKSGVGRR